MRPQQLLSVVRSKARNWVRAALANDWLVVASLMMLGFLAMIAAGIVIVEWFESIGLADVPVRRTTRSAFP